MKKVCYPGTFDPISSGHINILEKASVHFDEIILAVAGVTGKNTLFSLEERTELCRSACAHLPNVTVTFFNGLAVEFAKSQGCEIIIRGLRAVSDFEYELSIALTNKKLEKCVDTFFLIPSYRYLYLSSTIIRQVAEARGNLTDMVPENVRIALENKFKQ
ncbi:MAG: pantetheine-phosphate adenylyltransferase [Candidatus Cloacimonetes bacterium]|nr:pantetheine-phosphate adenylyltransferase [Candidatus Cloacimonadota bacterium]